MFGVWKQNGRFKYSNEQALLTCILHILYLPVYPYVNFCQPSIKDYDDDDDDDEISINRLRTRATDRPTSTTTKCVSGENSAIKAAWALTSGV